MNVWEQPVRMMLISALLFSAGGVAICFIVKPITTSDIIGGVWCALVLVVLAIIAFKYWDRLGI